MAMTVMSATARIAPKTTRSRRVRSLRLFSPAASFSTVPRCSSSADLCSSMLARRRSVSSGVAWMDSASSTRAWAASWRSAASS